MPFTLLTTPATLTFATLDQFKAQLGIEYDTDDTRLNDLLYEAADQVETDIGLCLRPQVWTQTQPCWGNTPNYASCVVQLQKTPVTEVTVQYFDPDNELQTFTDYVLAQDLYRAVLYSSTWPATYNRPDAVQITLTCGLPQDEEDNINHPIWRIATRATLLLAAHYNENREAEVAGITNTSVIKLGYDRLINLVRKWSVVI